MQREEIADWLRLTMTPGIGDATARKLLRAFGLPSGIFLQSSATLAQVVHPAQAAALCLPPVGLQAQLDATWNWLTQTGDKDPLTPCRAIVTLGDPHYPTALLDIADPPLLLYWIGHPGLGSDRAAAATPAPMLHRSLANCIAIVGSRNPTAQGAANARLFARQLSQTGMTVVSGMALGIDGCAHEGALDGVGSDSQRMATIAVVGTGLDRVYPKGHLDLARRIAQNGMVLSEFAIGTPPLAANFPQRNRIIAGLARGTLVVEAALRSGSLITARIAAEQGKEVFAIPGSIHSTQARGCHALIKQGAKLVESAQDLLEELGGGDAPLAQFPPDAFAEPIAGAAQTEGDDALLHALGFDPVGLDALQARCAIATPSLQAKLMELELQGRVARLAGGLFQRTVRA